MFSLKVSRAGSLGSRCAPMNQPAPAGRNPATDANPTPGSREVFNRVCAGVLFAFWVKEPTNERQEIGREVGVVPFVDTQDHTFGVRQLQVGFCFLDLSVRLPNQILREREEYIVPVASEFWERSR